MTQLRRDTPLGRLRHRLYSLLEAGGSTPTAAAFDQFMVGLISLNVFAVVLESVPSIERQFGTEFFAFEVVSIAIFTIEYLARLWVAIEIPIVRQRGPIVGRLMFASRFSMLVDLFAFAPFYIAALIVGGIDLRVLRVFRLLRFMKLVRYSPAMLTLRRALYEERRALVGAFILMIGTAVFSGAIMHAIEPSNFQSIPEGMWWALATLTTIGYGDAVPHTPAGKIFGAMIMVLGLGLFALPIGIVATAFVNEIHRRDFVVTWGMVARVPLFSTLNAASIAEVMKIMRTRMLTPGTVLAARGDEAEGMYFIADGELRIDLPRRQLQLGAGEFFGEVALLKKVRRIGNVTALTRCHVMIIDAADFESLIRRDENLREQILAIAEERLAGDWADVTGDVTPEDLEQKPSVRPEGDPVV